MNTQNDITVIIADDHEMLLEGFCSLFKNTNIQVLARAKDGEELLELVRKYQPHVVVTDIRMPLLDGAQVTQIIKKEFPHIKVLALTSYDEVELMKEMKQAGAEGFALKNAGREELLSGIRAIKEGRSFYCSYTAKKLLSLQLEPLPPTVSFTKREKEVMKWIIRGNSNKEIGKELFIDSRTVEFHRANIYAKTGTKNAVHLGMWVAKHGVEL